MATTTKAAADAILSADFLLIAVGAGFSADSGLPVYNDIAKVDAYKALDVEYHDLCQPYLVHVNPPIFYGFWGDCFNMYRDTAGHPGYEILQAWKERLCAKGDTLSPLMDELKQAQFPDLHGATTDPFFVYTSNVDAHFLRYFGTHEVYEIHGNTETWQCAGQGEGTEPCEGTWNIPADFRFPVNKTTMLYDEISPPPPFLRCPKCNAPGRPNVLMFGDQQWLLNREDERRYVVWEASVEETLRRDSSKRLVILEIGCGLRVPSVRMECQMVLADIQAKTEPNKQVQLIRINPIDDDDNRGGDALLKINSTGLAALQEIASYMATTAASSDN
ncbi:hypothetical protein LEN26_000045 [Aphanomyces euteiches]|nr:hypothetical protein LEN26_000045 [Aphanomyces euteiches]